MFKLSAVFQIWKNVWDMSLSFKSLQRLYNFIRRKGKIKSRDA